ncbi:MAG: dockerin type I repeat-containing protein, partial [Oscillospiraceae bacterium]|nr:dockerin type I repeat-containing protein [Oscillospiraceae bacterium]
YESQEIELVAGKRNSLAVDASTNSWFMTSIYEVNSLVLGYEVNGNEYPIPASYTGYDIASGIRMNMDASGYLQISTNEGVGPYTITIKPIVGTPESVGAAPDFVEDSIDITDVKVLGADVVSAEWDGDTLNIVLAEGTAENAMIKTLWTVAVNNNNGGGQALFNINGKLQTPGAHATFDWAYGLTLENGTATGKVVFAQANVYWDPDSQLNFTDKIFTVNLSVEGAEPDTLLGDVNLDGKVNNIDATLVLRYSVGGLTEEQLAKLDVSVGDVNGDGKVNNIDATIILRYSVGSITELPYEA